MYNNCMKESRLNFYATAAQGQGYSGSAEQMAISLDKRADIDLSMMGFNPVPNQNVSTGLRKIKNKPFQLADVGIVYGFPAAFNSNVSKYKVGYTMFETDKLPSGKQWAGMGKDAADTINSTVDLLFVPCQHNKNLFRASGVEIPIEVVPCGINPELFPFVERDRPEDHVFTFFMHGTLTLRKNPGMVISAFASLFKDNPGVKLVLKTQSGTLGHIEYVDMGNIEVIDDLWSVERLNQAMRDADCYVFPSRGEGFGIPPLEAMSTGLPTIFTNNTGMSDYANEEFNMPIRIIKKKPAQRYPKKWGDVGLWYEPDYEQLKAYMKWVYENQEEAKEMGRRASVWVRRNWTYDNAATKAVEAIRKHYKSF